MNSTFMMDDQEWNSMLAYCNMDAMDYVREGRDIRDE